jgi:hypothetical protein
MASGKLQTEFNRWLEAALKEATKSDARAFCFNLSEPWSIEVVGARKFDDADSDWGCDEVYRPKQKEFWLPPEEVGDDWETVFESAKGLIARYCASNFDGAALLLSSEAVAVGFVDGELHVIHRKEK